LAITQWLRDRLHFVVTLSAMPGHSLTGCRAVVTGAGRGIGKGVAFLVGDDASYLTNQTIHVDGGPGSFR
jgi:NAD(P)-dependent dehydrogenase (short-subunit alcohol dehydrogenase family)